VTEDTTPTPELPPAGWYRNPEGAGQRYWDGAHWSEHYADDRGQITPVPPPPATARRSDGLVTTGYILAVLLPIVGFIIGIVLLTRRNDQGAWVMVASVAAFVVWSLILSSSGY
jgi:Protein of unknown function (DUF2510)